MHLQDRDAEPGEEQFRDECHREQEQAGKPKYAVQGKKNREVDQPATTPRPPTTEGDGLQQLVRHKGPPGSREEEESRMARDGA